MKEDFLYYIWQYKLFSQNQLFTSNGLSVFVRKSGAKNSNSGPDFLNAQMDIDNQLWVGNVEIHVKSSDWYLHNHEKDPNYDAVILHVVWENDTDVFMKNNKPLPTLVLKNIVDKSLLESYQNLIYHQVNFIPCEKQINSVDEFILKNWLERLYFERLESKSKLIYNILKTTNNDFEATFFQLLAKNFGLKINADAFLQLTKSVDFSVIRKVRFDLQKLTALLFGLAGFLKEDIDDNYYKLLKIEYNYLKHKYQLKASFKTNFQFFRMRPNNFPTIRIAQLASLFFQHQNLFSKILSLRNKVNFYELLRVGVDEFWQEHYTFNSKSKKSKKMLTKSFIDLLLINTIIPLKFVYLKQRGEVIQSEILNLIHQISPEKNSIIQSFSDLKIIGENAMHSQALLTLKNQYCSKKRCLDCAIGNVLLRQKSV